MSIDLNWQNKNKWRICQKKYINKIEYQKKISKFHQKMKNLNKNQSIQKNTKKNKCKIKQFKEVYWLKNYHLEKYFCLIKNVIYFLCFK